MPRLQPSAYTCISSQPKSATACQNHIKCECVPVRVWHTSRLGLFGMYVSPIGDVISQHNVQYHQYADDMQLYVSLNPTNFGTLSDTESCASDVSRWLIENALLLNSTKTEAVVVVQASGCLKSTSHRACGSQELTCSSLTPSSCLQ